MAYNKEYYENRRNELLKEDFDDLQESYLEVERIVSKRFQKFQIRQNKLKELAEQEKQSHEQTKRLGKKE